MVFPMLHGVPGEDGTVQAVLALHNIPFIGCDMAACVAAMDKQFTKNIAAANGVPVIPGFVAKRGIAPAQLKGQVDDLTRQHGGNFIIKPHKLWLISGVEIAQGVASNRVLKS